MWKQSMGDYLRPGTRKGRNRLVCPKPLRHISTPRVGAPGQETGWLGDWDAGFTTQYTNYR
jgi:hypothetical protein